MAILATLGGVDTLAVARLHTVQVYINDMFRLTINLNSVAYRLSIFDMIHDVFCGNMI